jgi:hypothetical protein
VTFWLGTSEVHWLERTDVPLFISARRLRRRKKIRAKGSWALDSGAFTELSTFGEWTVPSMTYAREVQRWQKTVGNLQWASIQDWMCEPFILAKTGLRQDQHQSRTIANYRELLAFAPDVPWVPVLQGWEFDDYIRHLKQYACAGYDLTKLPLVGLGSVCRRQDTAMAEELIRHLYGLGVKLHLFGFKTKGLKNVYPFATSSDSTAWSYQARRGKPLAGCLHQKCNNCMIYALQWRNRVVRIAERKGPIQGSLFT